ncbi:MAG: tetratricopeptide repeat protein [Phycisphaerales bacterium]|nr:tetratricopeptide repeat protein [Planctomycetota bacterium]MBL6998016.1 tetratricopeptide repeat protein [Phycisphaerales bacterium]
MAKQTDPRLLQAMQAIASGQSTQAEELCRLVLTERKRDDLAMALLAQACNSSGKYDEAMQLIKSAIAKNNKRADYHGLLADMLTTQGDFRGALGAYDKALKLQPNHHGVIAGKANTWLRMNKPQKAIQLVEPLVKKGGEDLTISIVYAKARIEHGDSESAADVLLARLPATQEPIETRRTLYFTLGKAMEKAGEYKSAFEAYEEGNKLSASGFDLDACVKGHDDIIKAFPVDSFASMPTSNNEDTSRVFIVGMLRSGSTLTEQIIDAHPLGRGLGELESLPRLLSNTFGEDSLSAQWSALSVAQLDVMASEYLLKSSCKTNEKIFVDKQLGNYQFVGVVKKLFPNAKIIHCTRNPLSMGISCFAQKLPPHTNSWASKLNSIGHFYNEYMRMMRHWKACLGSDILEVSYEELVENQESTTRKILEFCGLEFDPKCMEFWKTGRTVLTLSQDQVRKPMYVSSIARHEQFGELLDPLIDALGV